MERALVVAHNLQVKPVLHPRMPQTKRVPQTNKLAPLLKTPPPPALNRPRSQVRNSLRLLQVIQLMQATQCKLFCSPVVLRRLLLHCKTFSIQGHLEERGRLVRHKMISPTRQTTPTPMLPQFNLTVICRRWVDAMSN